MKVYKYIDQFILVLIVLNVVAMILESHQSLRIRYQGFFNAFELVSISIFSIEYIYRILHNFNKKKIKGCIFLYLQFFWFN
jgi:voltage-gated potassium channel